MASRIFRAGIIGCGNIAGGYDPNVPTRWSATHAGAYHLCADTKLVAVADPDSRALSRFQEKWGGKSGYADYREMLENEQIDILSLCLPTPLHFPAFNAVMKTNIRAVFCEKPLSTDLGEARHMAEVGNKGLVAVNYFRRWNPTLASLRERVVSGEFGLPRHVVVRYPKGVFVNASHFIDLLRWFFGEAEEVRFVRTVIEDSQDPGLDFIIEYQQGMSAHFLNTKGLSYVFADVDMLFDKARIVIGQRGQTLSIHPVVPEPHYRQFDIMGNTHEMETQWRNCTTRAVEELVRLMGTGEKPVCTLEDGVKALEICYELMAQKEETCQKT